MVAMAIATTNFIATLLTNCHLVNKLFYILHTLIFLFILAWKFTSITTPNNILAIKLMAVVKSL